MLWLKAFHIVFVVTWFAGLFGLPRLFVHHTTVRDAPGNERFKTMERGMIRIMTIGAVLAAIFGISMVIMAPGFLEQRWLHAKLTLVALLIAYHVWCYRLVLGFRADANRHSERWYRLFNEIPSVFLIAIVILVVLKPF